MMMMICRHSSSNYIGSTLDCAHTHTHNQLCTCFFAQKLPRRHHHSATPYTDGTQKESAARLGRRASVSFSARLFSCLFCFRLENPAALRARALAHALTDGAVAQRRRFFSPHFLSLSARYKGRAVHCAPRALQRRAASSVHACFVYVLCPGGAPRRRRRRRRARLPLPSLAFVCARCKKTCAAGVKQKRLREAPGKLAMMLSAAW